LDIPHFWINQTTNTRSDEFHAKVPKRHRENLESDILLTMIDGNEINGPVIRCQRIKEFTIAACQKHWSFKREFTVRTVQF